MLIELYPSRLLIIQSLELSPVLLQVLHNEVLPSLLGVQGSKDFPASRCVASKFPFDAVPLQQEITMRAQNSALPNLTMRRTHRQGLMVVG